MTSANKDSPIRLLRQLYFNRTGIVFLLMVLASVLMLVGFANTHGTISQFWLALGSATIATTGYSFVQALLTARQFDQFLTDAIKENIRREISSGADAAMETFHSLQSKYLPTVTYPALNVPNPNFNRDLNNSLKTSAHYIFRGLTARYAVVRLASLATPPRDVKIVIADPAKPAAVDFRARHEASSGDEEAFDKAKQEILDGIHMSIAGAYLTRRRYDHLEFYFTSIPHVDRVEICDDAIYVTSFSDSAGDGAKFPSTKRFDHASLIYQMFFNDCNSLLASPYITKLEMPGSLTESQLLQSFKDIGITTDKEYWESMKQRFNSFRSQIGPDLNP